MRPIVCSVHLCGKPSVTRDGRRLCMKHLRDWCRQQTPIPNELPRPARTNDQRQDIMSEPSPWQENAIRHMEG